MEHYRVIFPVGHGGFAFEHIEGMSVVCDCGSDSSPYRVKKYIDNLKAHGITQINHLVLSHFDKDHVNCLDYLLNNIAVRNVHALYVPDNMKVFYNTITGGAYSAILSRLQNISEDQDIKPELYECEEEKSLRYSDSERRIWEWILQPMMTQLDWNRLLVDLKEECDTTNDSDFANPDFLSEHAEEINSVVKSTFGPTGPNSKGLIMLSRKCQDVKCKEVHIERGGFCHCHYHSVPHCVDMICEPEEFYAQSQNTACLYVGDANLKSPKAGKNQVQTFLRTNHENDLLLMQIPHHGSQGNRDTNFDSDFPAEFYFVHDKNEERIQKKSGLYDCLTTNRQLLMVRDWCGDLMLNITRF